MANNVVTINVSEIISTDDAIKTYFDEMIASKKAAELAYIKLETAKMLKRISQINYNIKSGGETFVHWRKNYYNVLSARMPNDTMSSPFDCRIFVTVDKNGKETELLLPDYRCVVMIPKVNSPQI